MIIELQQARPEEHIKIIFKAKEMLWLLIFANRKFNFITCIHSSFHSRRFKFKVWPNDLFKTLHTYFTDRFLSIQTSLRRDISRKTHLNFDKSASK